MPRITTDKLGFARRAHWRPGPLWASTLLVLAACTLGQAAPRDRVCTLIGCGPSLEIALVGEHVPTDFSLQVSTSTGELINVHCTEGAASVDPPEAAHWSPACPAGSVTFQDFAPEQFSATVTWADGETTQEFQPAYVESRPNGAGCDPACRTARVELRIPLVPPYGDVSTWELYTDAQHGFSLRYPAALQLEIDPQTGSSGVVFVGERIQLRASPDDPLVCQGDCPMIESNEPVTIAGRPARLVRGYIGAVGGNIPQRFMLYLIRSGRTYISLTLFAAGRQAAVGDLAVILPLERSDIELFDRIVETLELAP